MYLRVKPKPTPKVWFADQPYGVNKVSSTIKQICKEAGLERKFTNHSLWGTCGSRLYQNDVPKQVIKEITGHTSDCVRVYKRTSDEIHDNASCTISGKAKHTIVEHTKFDNPPIDNNVMFLVQEMVDCVVLEVDGPPKLKCASAHEGSAGTLSACQMINNICKTKIEMRKKKEI